VVRKCASPAWDEAFQISVPLESTEFYRSNGQKPGQQEFEIIVEILDAGKGEPPPPSSSTSSATEAGRSSSSLIGHATLGESDLRFPETGPPCKVLELPLELPTASTAAGGGVRRRHTHAQGGPHRPAIVLFIERPRRVFLE
ncbi:unnamed protein product, partial [Laminaria digitata]